METTEVRTDVALKNIMVATDFSSTSKVALKHAAAIVEHHASNLYVIHVIPPLVRTPIPIETLAPEVELDRRQAKADLAEFVADETLAHIPHQELLERGEISGVLSELVQKYEIDLLVLGTHGRGGIGKILLGSVAEAVFRQVRCPVLTIGPAVPTEPKDTGRLHQILFATDFGPASLSALTHAIAMAQDDNAKLILLHVLVVPPALYADARWYSQADLMEQLEPTRRAAYQKLEQLIPSDTNLPVKPECIVVWDTLPHGILNAAEERQADLIVMGVNPVWLVRASTHIPWATAHEVVRHAKCPVLTVRRTT